jgi:hypothetical protein
MGGGVGALSYHRHHHKQYGDGGKQRSRGSLYHRYSESELSETQNEVLSKVLDNAVTLCSCDHKHGMPLAPANIFLIMR